MPSSAQSRIQVLDNPILAPGVCALCGSSGDGQRKFIDFGKQLDWFGAVYLCTECIREVAEASGYIPVASFDQLHTEYRELQIKCDQLVAKYKPFEEAIEHVMESRNSMSNLGIEHLRSNVDNFETSGDAISDISESGGGESSSDESIDVEGSDDLFDSSDFDDD
jgi:hypothetical protein